MKREREGEREREMRKLEMERKAMGQTDTQIDMISFTGCLKSGNYFIINRILPFKKTEHKKP